MNFYFWKCLSVDKIPPSTIYPQGRCPLLRLLVALCLGKLLGQELFPLERDLNLVKLPNSTEETEGFSCKHEQNPKHSGQITNIRNESS